MELEIIKAKLSQELEEYIVLKCTEYCEDLDVFDKQHHTVYIEKIAKTEDNVLRDALLEISIRIDFDGEHFLINGIDLSCNNQSSISELVFNDAKLFDWKKFARKETWDEHYEKI